MCAEPFGRNPLEAASRSASESRFAHGHKNECGRDLRVPKTGRDLVVRQVDVGLCVARKLRAGDARPPQRDVLRRIKKLAESLEPIAKMAGVQFVEDRPQIEVLALLGKSELPLHGQHGTGNSTFRGGHNSGRRTVSFPTPRLKALAPLAGRFCRRAQILLCYSEGGLAAPSSNRFTRAASRPSRCTCATSSRHSCAGTAG